jgi:hypothetical protein
MSMNCCILSSQSLTSWMLTLSLSHTHAKLRWYCFRSSLGSPRQSRRSPIVDRRRGNVMDWPYTWCTTRIVTKEEYMLMFDRRNVLDLIKREQMNLKWAKRYVYIVLFQKWKMLRPDRPEQDNIYIRIQVWMWHVTMYIWLVSICVMHEGQHLDKPSLAY